METKPLVLLVEDDPALSEVAADYLREVGFEVGTAGSGREGLEKARKVLPDVIVSDITMQNGTGLFLLENLKRQPATHIVPFIFITARDTRADLRQGMALGADDYITKPFTMNELEASIRGQLTKRARRSSAAAAFDRQHLFSLPHELRTPLNGILGITDLMRDGLVRGHAPSPSELEDHVEILHESGLRLFRLVENYLLYYELRLASGNPGQADLYLRDRAEVPLPPGFFESLCARHKRPSDVRATMEPARLPIGSELLRKVVFELVDNALKFSDPCEIVHVAGSADGGLYRITVRDHGVGMTREQIDEVAPFIQFGRAAMEQQGVGLGLCLVRLIAEILGVELAIDSEPGKGTTVSLTFRIDAADS
ncbi:MAG: response regulator [Puniceicoccaceae bacterium]